MTTGEPPEWIKQIPYYGTTYTWPSYDQALGTPYKKLGETIVGTDQDKTHILESLMKGDFTLPTRKAINALLDAVPISKHAEIITLLVKMIPESEAK